MLDKLCSGVSHTAVGHESMLMNQQYIVNIHCVSSYRNTNKTRLSIDELMET